MLFYLVSIRETSGVPFQIQIFNYLLILYVQVLVLILKNKERPRKNKARTHKPQLTM